MTRPPATRIDHYELLEHLADGAQAEVHFDRIDPEDYDLSPEPAISAAVGGSEGPALARFL